MKLRLITAAVALMTLTLATGFSCNRNNPPEPQTEMAPPAQEEMGAPADGSSTQDGMPSPEEPPAPSGNPDGTSTTNE